MRYYVQCIVMSPIGALKAVAASILTDSAALLAYGLESFVDLGASVLVVWRFWDNTDEVEGLRANLQREERANVGIAATVGTVAPCSLPLCCGIMLLTLCDISNSCCLWLTSRKGCHL